jgi:hypothetical protein
VVIRSLAGLAPFQIAFVVEDLERAVREFDARLGAGPWRGHRAKAASTEASRPTGRSGSC